MSVFSATSDPYLVAAQWVGSIALALTLTLAAVIVLLRLRLQRQERRWSKFVERWRPLLLAMMMGWYLTHFEAELATLRV